MFCLRCGAYNQDGQRFCSQCGAPLETSVQKASPANYTMPVTPEGGDDQIDPTTFFQPSQGPDQSMGFENQGYVGVQRVVDPASSWITPDTKKKSFELAPFLIGLVSSVAVFGLVALLMSAGPLKGLLGGGDAGDAQVKSSTTKTDDDTPPKEEPPADDYDDQEDDVAEDPAEESISGTEEDDLPPYRASLKEYSWEELGQIAELIESCTRRSDALSIAQDYHLVNPSGTYPTATKTVKMSDGKKIRVELVGVWHDKANTESGKAGLTFMAVDCAYTHRMASGTTTPGGWQGSELRSWLQSDIYAKLPKDLSERIVSVYKMSNNTGKTNSVSSVTQTFDTLWIPSIPEICGPVNWTYTSNPANSSFYNSVFNAEGTQYEAFAQKTIDTEDNNSCLQLGKGWWLRSTAASTGRGRHVSPEGDPSKFGDSNEAWGVAFGFCL